MDNFIDQWEFALTGKITNKKPLLYVYSIEFSDNSVYVGITKNPKKREVEHISKSGNAGVRSRIGKIPHIFRIVKEVFDLIDSGQENRALIEYTLIGFKTLNKVNASFKNQMHVYMGSK